MQKRFIRLAFLSGLLISNFSSRAQYIELGLHGGGGGAMLINNNVSDQDDKLDYAASFGPVYGVQTGIYGRSGAGIAIEFNGMSVNQRYEGDILSSSGTSTRPIGRFLTVENVRYWEVPVLFRKYSRSGSGFLFEVGPKISFLDDAETRTEVTEFDPNSFPFLPFTVEEDRYITRGFRNIVVSGVLGLGGSWEVAPGLQCNTRLRLSYGFTDATEEYTKDQLARVNPDKIGLATTYAHEQQNGSYGYEPTNIASAHLMLGFAYRFPIGKGGQRGRAKKETDSFDD